MAAGAAAVPAETPIPCRTSCVAISSLLVEVTIAFDGEEADAASLLEIMTLGAKHGDVVTLSTEDDGAGEVLDSLVALLSRDLDQE